jgi:L-2-hydroxyglutarate oxidase LhgO
MLYEHCAKHSIPYQKTGKLVVARKHQLGYIENLHTKATRLAWPMHSASHISADSVLPTKLLTGAQARKFEPDLSGDIVAALWCPETGIVDSHSLMESLEKDIIESESGQLVYSTRVVRVDPYKRSSGSDAVDGWVVQTVTGDSEEGDAILARTLINASGLSGPLILNSFLPESSRIPMYYARGSYASYNGPGVSRISQLIYPCPDTTKSSHAFQSLGTHLTLDLQGKIRFGPDIEWISPPDNHQAGGVDVDFWAQHLIPDDSRLTEMHKAVTDYLPEVTLEGMQPDYVGIRPKLVGPLDGFQDFVIRTDYLNKFGSKGPMISLLGIESPGLTSCLAIAEMVVEDIVKKS